MNRRPLHFFQSIYFKIPLLFVFILLVAFQFVGVFFIDQLETQSVNSFKAQINSQTLFLTNNLSPILMDNELAPVEFEDRMNQALRTFSAANPVKIWVINAEETIIATDQGGSRGELGTQTNSNIIRNVLLNQTTYGNEYMDAETLSPYYQVVMPIFRPDQSELLGAVAIEADMAHIYTQADSIVRLFLQSAILAVIVALTIALVLSQGLTRPIEAIRQQAIRISEGVYNFPAEVYSSDELGELTHTINELAEKVQDAQESTESERQRLDSVLRHMRDGVIGTDRRGHIILVNARALYLLNIHNDQALGQSIIDVLGLEGKYRLMDFMAQDKEILIYQDEGEDEDTTVLKGEFSVIRRETGFVTGFVCVLTDVTEQQRIDRERRDLVSNVSHELRTPLTSVKSYSEALIDGAWKDETLAPQFLEVIQSEANRMIRMVSNLLDLSKIDGGQIILQTDFVDLKRVVNHIIDRFELTLDAKERSEKNYKIVREFTSRYIYVNIDQDRITQVIDNLISNAIKYSPDGGTITVKIEDRRDTVVIRVIDEGLGISQADIEHLFDRFYRVDKARSREQGGSGLGLAISKEVIELHGGHIWVNSLEGQGSVFSFDLPYNDFNELDLEEWE